MDKQTLRRYIRQQSAGLSESYLASASKTITDRVVRLVLFQKSRCLFLYVSTPREVQTREILETAWAMGKTVCVPRCGSNRQMDAVPIQSWDELSPGTMGILEPEKSLALRERPPLDLAIVPCVSASRSGARLGHGGGYYDRFLSEHRLPTICLCPDALLCEDIPMGEQDVWMDMVITESGLWNSRKL